MKRTPLPSLYLLSLGIREPNETTERELWLGGHLVVYRRDNGSVVATVQRDDLFDAHGNRFGEA